MSGYVPKKVTRGKKATKTNQIGLKMSGCPSRVGKKATLGRFIGRRVNCMNGLCGPVFYQGNIWRQTFRNVYPYCKPKSTTCLAAAGGVGNIYTPYYRTPAHGEGGCGHRIEGFSEEGAYTFVAQMGHGVGAWSFPAGSIKTAIGFNLVSMITANTTSIATGTQRHLPLISTTGSGYGAYVDIHAPGTTAVDSVTVWYPGGRDYADGDVVRVPSTYIEGSDTDLVITLAAGSTHNNTYTPVLGYMTSEGNGDDGATMSFGPPGYLVPTQPGTGSWRILFIDIQHTAIQPTFALLYNFHIGFAGSPGLVSVRVQSDVDPSAYYELQTGSGGGATDYPVGGCPSPGCINPFLTEAHQWNILEIGQTTHPIVDGSFFEFTVATAPFTVTLTYRNP